MQKNLYIKILEKIDEIEHDFGYYPTLTKYREQALEAEKKGDQQELKKILNRIATYKSKLKKLHSCCFYIR